MMSKIYITLVIFFLFILGVSPMYAQGATDAEANVIWLHGLKGNSEHWAYYANLFESERKINSINPFYVTTDGIEDDAEDAKWRIESAKRRLHSENLEKNIGVGHSLGGLVLREMDRKYVGTSNQQISSIITVNTPNSGAPISNAIENGNVNNFSSHGIAELFAGPSSQFIPFSSIFSCVLNILRDGVIGISHQYVTSFVSDAINQLKTLTNKELKLGSPKIKEINEYRSSTPMVSVWSEEESPVHWRLASEKISGDDTTFPHAMMVLGHVYNGMFTANIATSVVNIIFLWWNPYSWVVSTQLAYSAIQWKKGKDWLGDSEGIWGSLIGTTRLEEKTYYEDVYVYTNAWKECVETVNENLDEYMEGPDPFSACRDLDRTDTKGHWEHPKRTRLVSVNYPSDGLLPKYAQLTDNIRERYEVKGENHMEVLNIGGNRKGGLWWALNDRFNDRSTKFFVSRRELKKKRRRPRDERARRAREERIRREIREKRGRRGRRW